MELIDVPTASRSADLADLRAWADQAPVIRLVNTLLAEAIAQSASDIHLEPFETGLHVRYRLDGVLQRVRTLPKRVEAGIVSRIKIMADLDIAERRLPQDGRLKLRYEGREIDVRVSSMPTVCGESVCMRLLDRQVVRLSLGDLGLHGASLEQFTRAIDCPGRHDAHHRPDRIRQDDDAVLGHRTATARDVKIMTVEDPVEYYLDGVTQVAVHDDIGRTFATVLRTFLRHDPDILLVGEMRDGETAQIGIRAALTGHLVLATLHTIDCPSAIPRLLDMGIPGSLLASCLRLTVAQRLVRRICSGLPGAVRGGRGGARRPRPSVGWEWQGGPLPRTRLSVMPVHGDAGSGRHLRADADIPGDCRAHRAERVDQRGSRPCATERAAESARRPGS